MSKDRASLSRNKNVIIYSMLWDWRLAAPRLGDDLFLPVGKNCRCGGGAVIAWAEVDLY